MGTLKKKNLLNIGFQPGEALKLALAAMADPRMAGKRRDQQLELLEQLLRNPEGFRKHQVLGPVVDALIGALEPKHPVLRGAPLPFRVYGADQIEAGAMQQMRTAMSLPVAAAGALMADAHQGYGLPIGGVLAVEGAVIPYAVGVDIGCRMCLSVYEADERYLERHQSQLRRHLLEETVFGTGAGPARPMADPVLERREFQEIEVLKPLRDKAWRQIGSSGSGNHFVEFGVLELMHPEPGWGLPPGRYLALLSHSGSRGLGAAVAGHFTRVARETVRLPQEAQHLAWLRLDTEAGQAYWAAMNLAGDYASACHDHIHRKLARAIGLEPRFRVENHHNFAWKERLPDGREAIVHRKGATPAGAGVLGVIPGSMTAPGFLVRGTGSPESLSSASHGAGRRMSRTEARRQTTRYAMERHLREQGVELIGGDVDESPAAYKDIAAVMAAQRELVEVLGRFEPRIVRMATEAGED